jgi:hypothetical protein
MKNTLEELKAKYRSVRVSTRTIAGHEYRYATVYDKARRRSREFSLGRTDTVNATVKTTVKDTVKKDRPEGTVKPSYSTPKREQDVEELLRELSK